MFLRKLVTPTLGLFLLIGCSLVSVPACAQQDNSSSSQSQNDNSVEGIVVSSSRNTFVVRSDDEKFHLFTYDRNAVKRASIAAGTRVRVDSSEGDREGARQATNVAVLEQGQNAPTTAQAKSRQAAPLPPSMRHVENQIQREARRWRMGVHAGVGLDPELVTFGVHSQMGPIFSRNLFFRPSADFAWGEVTDMVGLNLEGVYRLPVNLRGGNWAPYLGAGPALNFIHQSYQTQPGQGRSIEFGNFDYETGLNILMGIQSRGGTFFEAKTSLYSHPVPTLRLIIGHNF